MLSLVSTCLLLLAFKISLVRSHGRLMEPPSRSSMWRVGFLTPKNYNDNELFCGGLTRQIRNGMKCGVCGDPWDAKRPRPNEAGGRYATGIISRRYQPGQTIETAIELTANHMGHFEFRLCPVNDRSVPETDECMAKYPLKIIEASKDDPYRYFLKNRGSRYLLRVSLPSNLTCSQCVFQWTYTAGNNWGRCAEGVSRVGCGPQETFRGCSDIAILSDSTETSLSNTRLETTKPPSNVHIKHHDQSRILPGAASFSQNAKTNLKQRNPTNAYTWQYNLPNRTSNLSLTQKSSTASRKTTTEVNQQEHASTTSTRTRIHSYYYSKATTIRPEGNIEFIAAKMSDASSFRSPALTKQLQRTEQNHRTTQNHGSTKIYGSIENYRTTGDGWIATTRPRSIAGPTITNSISGWSSTKGAKPELGNEILMKAKRTCSSVGIYAGLRKMQQWCELNCLQVPSHCPRAYCKCV